MLNSGELWYGAVLVRWRAVVGWQEVGEDMGTVVVAGGCARRWWVVAGSGVGAATLPCFYMLVRAKKRGERVFFFLVK